MLGALTSPGFRRQKQNELQGTVRLVSDLIDLYSEFKMAMAERFPKTIFSEGSWVTVDFAEYAFRQKLQAMDINFPLTQVEVAEYKDLIKDDSGGASLERLSNSILDFVELCWDSTEGKKLFQEKINALFKKHGAPFFLNDEGKIEAVLSVGLANLISEAQGASSEKEVDELVAQAVEFIRKPKLEDKRIAVEKLWDAFERLKTCVGDYDGRNKPETVDKIIRETAENSAIFTEIMENEMRALTEAGNGKLMIRHSEIDKTPINSTEHADYLFYRMLALVTLLRQSISAKAQGEHNYSGLFFSC